MKFPLLRTKAPIKEMSNLVINLTMSAFKDEPIGVVLTYEKDGWQIIDQTEFIGDMPMNTRRDVVGS